MLCRIAESSPTVPIDEMVSLCDENSRNNGGFLSYYRYSAYFPWT